MFSINSTLSRRNFLAGAAALGSTVALAGCSSGGSDGGSADDGKSFKIGVIGPLTGAAATYGVSAEKGAKLAAKDFSTKDLKLSLKSEDDVADGEKASTPLISGVGNGKFEPHADTTRGMIVTMLARMEGVDTSSGKVWYEAGQKWAMENGISDGTNMAGRITREQLATILYRYAKLKGYDVSASAVLSGYSDASQVSDWAQEAMQWAVGSGLIQGSGNALAPQANASRAEVATIFFRLLRDEVRDGAFTTSNTYSDVAYGKWYLQDNLIFAEGNPYCGTQIQGSAIYTDKYVKVDGEWLIEDTGYLRVYEESFQRDKTHRIRINMFRPKKKKVIKKK